MKLNSNRARFHLLLMIGVVIITSSLLPIYSVFWPRTRTANTHTDTLISYAIALQRNKRLMIHTRIGLTRSDEKQKNVSNASN